MKAEKIHKEAEIREIFELLWDILSLYEESDCYNCLPGTKDGDGAWEYFDGLIAKVRKKAVSLFLGERESETYRKLNTIIDETERFVKRDEYPGVAMRWREINPKMHYFDCVYELMDEVGPRTFVETAQHGRLDHIPTKKDVINRERYFEALKEKSKRDNLRYSEERIFQNELLETLTKVFEHDFFTACPLYRREQ